MTPFIALLRAVNVGGTGKLPMRDLQSICERIRFTRVKTYIASGNVVFLCRLNEADVKSALEERLAAYANRPIGVLVRTAPQMAAVLAANPFPNAAPNRTLTIFLDEPPPVSVLDSVTGKNDEELTLGLREIYVHYGDGMAHSKLKIPAARNGTARNMNTVAKLALMAAEL
jgi:uncharacterized protein (DUF1697 family)